MTLPALLWLTWPRGALGIYNITNRENPRDVYNNIASPNFSHFVGPQHRVFDTFLDIIY